MGHIRFWDTGFLDTFDFWTLFLDTFGYETPLILSLLLCWDILILRHFLFWDTSYCRTIFIWGHFVFEQFRFWDNFDFLHAHT